MAFSLDNYVDVATRLRLAFDKYPDLRVQETKREIVEMPDKSCFIRCEVTVWRDASDPIPAIATACELYPGKTSFSRSSENECGFTSALGRALGYMSFGISNSIATRDEVQAAQSRQSTHLAPVVNIHEVEQPFGDTVDTKQYASPKQRGMIRALAFEKKIGTTELMPYINKVLNNQYSSIEAITKNEASQVIESLQN
ncbi:hypothetical protein UFOVP979_1 [uncultured Caudovirales phage]|uniref:Uncharacterized protein n=1 Tax=uncultured Caudovirales phage TaxID=2100421 RepID=A0A6J7X4F1_9CAUD|nr:hypothetical protein UFOVP979_1 [uncultured Caudovirales phage]CAB4217219.1 hypothetical protein UFOVP1503_14 [uncultured Caudovirales phage]CAB5225769.1 hypothetical protein UFOVP1505_12 [uncultured Caudovirales phage]